MAACRRHTETLLTFIRVSLQELLYVSVARGVKYYWDFETKLCLFAHGQRNLQRYLPSKPRAGSREPGQQGLKFLDTKLSPADTFSVAAVVGWDDGKALI